MDNLALTHHAADEASAFLDALCDAYADAYGKVPGEDSGIKSSAFRDRATDALEARNYELVVARAGEGIVGFVFGYSLRPERDWWKGLKPEPPDGFTLETGNRTVVLAEIEVRQKWQGRGVGRGLHDAFLRGRAEERATLACSTVGWQAAIRAAGLHTGEINEVNAPGASQVCCTIVTAFKPIHRT
ncbi:GNAT family N-acetyltransferase [Micromonospora sp. DT44]|uniref:GNAT family N-acetyltransferase n=1 Tax=Micromonospora sp. DT44 TaxID=3393439 RepID=UPI003CEB3EDA